MDLETLHMPGLTPYDEAMRLQDARRAALEAGAAAETLLLLEHAPTVTMGRNTEPGHLVTSPAELEKAGIAVREAGRGGSVSYHGPGQMVAYPLLDLRRHRQSIRWYLRSLEEVLIRQLAGYGLRGERLEGLTGVWVDGAKVAAIGVGIRRWVTFHGIALNVSPNMAHFGLIVPCGIADKPVASLEALMGPVPDMAQVMADFESVFRAHFGAPLAAPPQNSMRTPEKT